MFARFKLPQYFNFHLRQEVKELYVAAAIADVALSAMMLFEPIYLYKSINLSVPQILLFFALVYAWYVLLIPFGGKYTSKFGLKHALVASVPFQILYWGALYFAPSWYGLIWVAPLFFAIQKSLYWPAFHSLLARYANRGQVAREFSMLSAIIQVVQIVGPFMGGLVAQSAGGQALLLVASSIYALSIIPLILHKDGGHVARYSFKDTLRLYKTQFEKALGYIGFGEELLALTIWPLFIFIIVNGYEETGLLLTISAALSAVLSLYVGKMTDGHPKRPLIKLGAFLTMFSWLARPFFQSPNGILAINTSAKVGKNVYFIPLTTVTYERAEARSILPYVVFFEQSLAVGKLLTALLAALLFALVPSFPLLFLLAALLSLLFLYI